jgi:hypothetical protein
MVQSRGLAVKGGKGLGKVLAYSFSSSIFLIINGDFFTFFGFGLLIGFVQEN